MNEEVIYSYLKDLGIEEPNQNDYLVKDLRLSSKEIVDFAVFIKVNFKVKMDLSKDMRLIEVFEKIKVTENEL